MAARQPTVGVDHLTVVPTNFEPDEDTTADAESDAGESGDASDLTRGR